MSYCRQCGNKLEETQKFCPICGTKVEAPTPVQTEPVYVEPVVVSATVEQKPAKEPVVYTVFSIIGLVGGIISIVLSCTFVYSLVAIFTGIPSMIFSSIAKKSIAHHGKAKAGFILSLLSIILGAVLFTVLIIITIVTGTLFGEGMMIY